MVGNEERRGEKKVNSNVYIVQMHDEKENV
jgi:hypothetical protein